MPNYTPSQVYDKYVALQKQLATNINNKGVTASQTELYDNLIDKVAQIENLKGEERTLENFTNVLDEPKSIVQLEYPEPKNLFDVGIVDDYYVNSDATINFAISDSTLSGVISSGAASFIYNTKLRFASGTYTFSSTNSMSTFRYLIRAYDTSGNILTTANLINNWIYNSYYNGYFAQTNNSTATIPETVAYWQAGLVFVGEGKVGETATYSNVQIEKGSTATPYEPYPAPKTLNAKLGCKNLFDEAAIVNTNVIGLTMSTNSDGSRKLTGTLTNSTYSYFNQVNLSQIIPKGTAVTVSGWYDVTPTDNYIGLVGYDKDNKVLFQANAAASGEHITTTLTADLVSVSLVIRCVASAAGDTVTFDNVKLQLEKGSTATTYTPYISDFSTVNVTRCGKNILEYPYVETTLTRNGLTFTDNKDGTITVNGTATADTQFRLQDTVVYPNNFNPFNSIIGKQIYINGSPEGSSKDTYAIQWIQTGNFGNGIILEVQRTYYRFAIFIKSGITVENLVFKPQIIIGSENTLYEPYNGKQYTPTATGEVTGISALYPLTNLITNNAGVVFEEVTGQTYKEILPSTDKNGITKAYQPSVDSTIDSNITSDNIKKDVNILGVTGDYICNYTYDETTKELVLLI